MVFEEYSNAGWRSQIDCEFHHIPLLGFANDLYVGTASTLKLRYTNALTQPGRMGITFSLNASHGERSCARVCFQRAMQLSSNTGRANYFAIYGIPWTQLSELI